MTLRRRLLTLVLALAISATLAGCDWEPVVCLGQHGTAAVCV